MINLRGGRVAHFFDFFNPSSIRYWLELVYNLSLIIAPVMVVVGAVKMTAHPERAWYVYFAGTAFHALILFLYLGKMAASLGNSGSQFDFYNVLQLLSSLLCGASVVWLLSKRVRSLADSNQVVITIALTCTWLILVIIHHMVNTIYL